MARITDNVELTAEQRAEANNTPAPTKAASAMARYLAARDAAREAGLLGKPVKMNNMTPREAIYKFAEDTEIPEEQRARFAKLRDEKLAPADALVEVKTEAAVTLALFKEEFVLSVAHERKLELQDRADARAEKQLQAAEAKKAEAEAKLAAKNGANTAPASEEVDDKGIPALPGAGEIPAQMSDADAPVPAAVINADVIKQNEEYADREALLEAASGKPAKSGNKSGK